MSKSLTLIDKQAAASGRSQTMKAAALSSSLNGSLGDSEEQPNYTSIED
jgi:hypothetical protein